VLPGVVVEDEAADFDPPESPHPAVRARASTGMKNNELLSLNINRLLKNLGIFYV
jgi:hypothetical protein